MIIIQMTYYLPVDPQSLHRVLRFPPCQLWPSAAAVAGYKYSSNRKSNPSSSRLRQSEWVSRFSHKQTKHFTSSSILLNTNIQLHLPSNV